MAASIALTLHLVSASSSNTDVQPHLNHPSPKSKDTTTEIRMYPFCPAVLYLAVRISIDSFLCVIEADCRQPISITSN